MNEQQINSNFSPKQIASNRSKYGLQRLEQIYTEAAENLDYLLNDNREKALAMTNLEQSMLWAQACITRDDEGEK